MADKRDRLMKGSVVLLLALWSLALVSIWKEMGLFNWIGVDFALFSAGSQILTSGRIEAVYEPGLETVARHLEPFHAFYRAGTGGPRVGPIPHLPLTLLLYTPFQGFALPWGYLLWVFANLLLALAIIRGLAARFPESQSGSVCALALMFLSLVDSLIVGQPIVLLLLAFDRAYRGWERGRDFQAGLWGGLLFLKVQYLPYLVLILAFKQRWRSLGGMAVTIALISLASLAMLGPRGLTAYLATLGSASSFRASHPMICPEQMINWRGLLVNTLPLRITNSQGTGLTLMLSAMTTGALLSIWRGPWDPNQPRFSMQMLATVLTTMLATFHNHIPGAALLLVPGMVLLSRGGGPAPLPLLLVLTFFVPTLHFTLTHHAEGSAMLMVILMAATLGVILRTVGASDDLVAKSAPHQGVVPDPVEAA